MARTPEATFPEIQTLIAPGKLGKMDQNKRLRRLEMSEMMMFWRRKRPGEGTSASSRGTQEDKCPNQ